MRMAERSTCAGRGAKWGRHLELDPGGEMQGVGVWLRGGGKLDLGEYGRGEGEHLSWSGRGEYECTNLARTRCARRCSCSWALAAWRAGRKEGRRLRFGAHLG
jgi:hypothetical protein